MKLHIPMRLEVYVLCYNESYLLPFFLEHCATHLHADKVVVYDNESTDNSVDICNSFKRCKIEVRTFHTGNKIRDDIYLQIKNNCWKGSSADWVIVCDMDEFLWIYDLNILADRIYDKYPVIRTQGWEMVSQVAPDHKLPLTTVITDGVRTSTLNKCILFRPKQIKEINYNYGCHECNPDSDIFVSMGEFKLLHYKFLSTEYVLNNFRERNLRLSGFNKELNLGFHYSLPEDRIVKQWNDNWILKQQAI